MMILKNQYIDVITKRGKLKYCSTILIYVRLMYIIIQVDAVHWWWLGRDPPHI